MFDHEYTGDEVNFIIRLWIGIAAATGVIGFIIGKFIL